MPNRMIAGVDRVTLVVDENRFVVDSALLAAKPTTMLGKMFGSLSGSPLVTPNHLGEFNIGDGSISAGVFRSILVSVHVTRLY